MFRQLRGSFRLAHEPPRSAQTCVLKPYFAEYAFLVKSPDGELQNIGLTACLLCLSSLADYRVQEKQQLP